MSRTEAGAEETRANLAAAGVAGRFSLRPGAFAGYVANGGVQGFLGEPAAGGG